MIDLLLSPLGPAIGLALSGMLLRIVARPPRASILALLTLLPLAMVLVLIMRLPSIGVPVWEADWWTLVLPPIKVLWALDGWNWLSLFLLVLTGTCAVLLTWRLPGRLAGAFHGMSLLLVASASLTVVSDNLLALGAAWVATDILLIVRSRGDRPTAGAAPVGLVAAGSLSMLLAIGITSLQTASSSFATAMLPVETLVLLLITAALRMAAYPMHIWLAPGGIALDRGTQWLITGTILITGGWLLGRIHPLGVALWLQNPVWIPVLAAFVILAGIAAWSSAGRDRFPLLGSSRATWMWLVLALASVNAGRAALGWAMIAAVLGLMLFVVGQAINEQWGWRPPIALAAATLASVPLTAGMPAQALAVPRNVLIFLLLAVGNGLALSCVLGQRYPVSQVANQALLRQPHSNMGPNSLRRVNWPVFRLLTAFGLASVPILLWGIRPEAVAELTGFGTVLSFGEMLRELGLAGLILVGASLSLGLALVRLADQPDVPLQEARARMAQATGLAWARPVGLAALSWLQTGWRTLLLVLEGEGYFGWLVLLLLVAGLVLLQA